MPSLGSKEWPSVEMGTAGRMVDEEERTDFE